MPEIAEVKTDADVLDVYCSQRQLLAVSFLNDKFKPKCQGLDELIAVLPLRILKVRSRAKKLIFYLEDSNHPTAPWFLFISYGMTGGVCLEPHDHAHLQFQLNHCWLGFNTFYYRDTRRIGSMEATNDPERIEFHLTDMAKPVILGWSDIGLEPITRGEFVVAIRECRDAYLASKLMDQRSICSGVGNYLLSEILCVARLDPWIRCNELSPEQRTRLWDALGIVISESYACGGVSMSDYVHSDGQFGSYQDSLRVYGRANETFEGRPVENAKGPHGRTVWYVDWDEDIGSDE